MACPRAPNPTRCSSSSISEHFHDTNSYAGGAREIWDHRGASERRTDVATGAASIHRSPVPFRAGHPVGRAPPLSPARTGRLRPPPIRWISRWKPGSRMRAATPASLLRRRHSNEPPTQDRCHRRRIAGRPDRRFCSSRGSSSCGRTGSAIWCGPRSWPRWRMPPAAAWKSGPSRLTGRTCARRSAISWSTGWSRRMRRRCCAPTSCRWI